MWSGKYQSKKFKFKTKLSLKKTKHTGLKDIIPDGDPFIRFIDFSGTLLKKKGKGVPLSTSIVWQWK